MGKNLLLKLFLLTLFSLPFHEIVGQVTIEFRLVVDGGNQGFSGGLRMCNNSGAALPAGYSINFRWASFNGFASGPTTTRNGTGNCDTWNFAFEPWQLPAAGQCKDISASQPYGAYNLPLTFPAYGIDSKGDTIWVQTNDPVFFPKSYNQLDWKYSFDRECFIPTSSMCLGEAQVREWNELVDIRVPQNRKGWALAAPHISTLFNNMAGANVVSINYAFAQSIIEGRMGCDAAIVPPAGDNNPLTFRAISTASGCFQILPVGWAQIEQFYPTLTAPLNYNDIIAGDNFITSGLSKVLFDMTTFAKYEKINCADPIGFFVNSADQYAAEELLAYAYHEGPNGSENALLKIFKTNRATLINETNLARYLQVNHVSASTQYSERMRNNLIQLENNFSIPGGHSALSGEASTNWVGGTPPNNYEWHGCYDEPYTWAEIDDYIDEAARLFWTADVALVKSQVQAAFNALNGGGPVNYSNLGTVIDAIVLAFPVYNPDEGIGEDFFASACGSPTVNMSTCDEICPGEKGELWVHLMGVPPFNYTVEGPTGTIYTKTGVTYATDVLKVNQPGTYKVLHIEDANGEVFLNCHKASAIIEEATDCSLPVTFLSIHAYVNEKKLVEVKWATASEKNNKQFIVERSKDGITFSPIGTAAGSENSNRSIYYSYTDENPLDGISYYRIRQVDIDGSTATSNIASVLLKNSLEILIIPNPNNGSFQIITKGTMMVKDVMIIDAVGREVVKLTSMDGAISFSGLAQGIYVVQVNSQDGVFREKVVVE
jgi:hypothetical protein